MPSDHLRSAEASDPLEPILHVAHTFALSEQQLAAAYALVVEVFGADLEAHDWEHSLGGVHALVLEGQRVIAHGAVVQRRLLHRGRALRAGYLEAIAVHPGRRRRGHGTAVLAALERVIAGAYDLGALGATELGARLYTARGWKQWRGRTSALTPGGVMPTTEEDGEIYVLEAGVPLDLDGELTCDWRDGSVW